MNNPDEQPDMTRVSPRRRRAASAQSRRTARRARVASSCARQLTGDHTVHVRAVRRNPPDLDRFVAALLALALAEHPTGQDEAGERS